MRRLLNRLLGIPYYPPVPRDSAGQMAWSKARFAEWQLEWHRLFDRDDRLIAAGEFDRPDPLPDDIDDDYRLMFGLSQARIATRRACFALFPEGEEMSKRLTEYLHTEPQPCSEGEARGRLHVIADLIASLEPKEQVDFNRIEIVDRDTEDGFRRLQQTDDITLLLERPSSAPPTGTEALIQAARHFLTKPLYASAGNYYQLRDWVTAAMVGGGEDLLYNDLYRLWLGGWQVALGADTVILAYRKV